MWRTYWKASTANKPFHLLLISRKSTSCFFLDFQQVSHKIFIYTYTHSYMALKNELLCVTVNFSKAVNEKIKQREIRRD